MGTHQARMGISFSNQELSAVYEVLESSVFINLLSLLMPESSFVIPSPNLLIHEII